MPHQGFGKSPSLPTHPPTILLSNFFPLSPFPLSLSFSSLTIATMIPQIPIKNGF